MEAFSTGIDKTDAVVIEGKAQCRTEQGKAAIFRFPFNDNDAPRIQGFLYFREVHNQMLFNFFTEVDGRPAGSPYLTAVMTIKADNVAVIINQSIRRMSDDK